MTEAIASGLPASIAAQSTLRDTETRHAQPSPPPGALIDELDRALAAFDEAAANAAFDRALATLTVRSLLADIVMPYLQRLGTRWEAGEASIAHEHFATGIVRGRLLGLARGWGAGSGRIEMLACPPREQHDLGLIVLGLMLRQHGWRIVMLGPNTPIATIAESADRIPPDLIVIASMQPELLDPARDELISLAKLHRVAIAGPGATTALAQDTGTWLIEGSPVDGATAVEGADEARRPATPV